MKRQFFEELQNQLETIQHEGLYKDERQIASSQHSAVKLDSGREVINFCANNYLGLADHPRLIEAAKQGLDHYGFGMASVRFICGTQTIHKELEARISQFLRMEDAILYPSCFDANGGLFETLLGPEDAIISDTLNHASIIDGVRLCKAKRFRYANNDMADLEAKLEEASTARHKLIATDGVFSMDGIVANLKAICDLADRYQALVMVDDSHATGFFGKHGRGTPEFCGVEGRIDILTSTLGKGMGGATGGFTAGRREIVEWLRQRSRPYLFSNSVAPSLVAASLEVFDMVEEGDALREQLWKNTARFREGMETLGFSLVPGHHAIVPVMLGDAALAKQFAARMLDEGVYVVGFSYPVVPKGQARIRVQLSAGHTFEQVDRAVSAFEKVGRELKII